MNFSGRVRMRILTVLVLLLLLATTTAPLVAQLSDVKLEQVVGREPLVGKQVRCILQDHLGYLWVGTERGLNRYDGYEFTAFTHDPRVEGSLSHPNVLSLCEDHQGILWVGTRAGLDRFDRRTETFTHFVPDSSSHGKWGNLIAGLREDSTGVLWTVGAGVCTFDRSAGKFTLVHYDSTNPESSPFFRCHAILEDKAGTLWVVTSWGLDYYDRTKGVMRHFWVDQRAVRGEEPDIYGYQFIQNILEDRTGKIWLATDAGPVAFDRSSGRFKKYTINPGMMDQNSAHSLSSVCEDDAGEIWIGVWGGGLMGYDAKADSFVALPTFRPLVPSFGVGSLYCDGAGTVWIGTGTNGLWKLVKQKRGFTPYTLDPKNPNGLSNSNIMFFFEKSPGHVSVVTGEGAADFDRHTGVYFDPEDRERPYTLTGWVRSRSGTVYTGTIDENFNVIQEKPYRRRELSTASAGLGSSACSLFEDRQGIIWMLTDASGLAQFNPRTERFKKLDIGRPQSFVTSHMIIEDSLSDRADGWALWIGTQDGLWYYDARSDSFRQFAHDPRDPLSISSNSITMLFQDRDHTLWIGTDQGLNRMDSTTGRFSCFGEGEGLSERRVLGILQDSHGRLWVSTQSMLSRFDTQTKRFNSYSMNQVIKDVRFAPGCCLRSTTGEMYFGGQGGFVLFDPDSVHGNRHVPAVVLTGYRVDDIPMRLDSALSEANAIVLSHNTGAISFEYAALDLVSPEANQYAYKLESYDTSWNYVGNRQVAPYRNVPPGNYTFRVKGSNNDGVWNEKGTSVALIIAPPPWRTTWAYLAYFGLATVGLYSIRRYQISRINARHRLEMSQMEAKALKEVDELKSRFFANISHEFRTPLTLISGPVRQLLSGEFSGDPREQYNVILRNTDRLLKLVNQLLDLSRLESGRLKLQVHHCDVAELARSIGASFESLAIRKRIIYRLHIPAGATPGYVDEDKLEKILTNLLGNALKFTNEGGEVSLTLQCSTRSGEEQAVITVADTGIGIAPEHQQKIYDRFYQVDGANTRSHEGTGIGLSLTWELVQLHKGHIELISAPGKGSSFVVTLPLSRASYEPDEVLEDVFEPAGHSLSGEVQPLAVDISDGQNANHSRANPHSNDPVVLLVEDNQDMRMYLRRSLESRYAIIEAMNGGEGVAQARKLSPDLIISDVMMPGMSGYDLCADLKSDDRTRSIPVILLSAKAHPRDKIEALGIGADDYLVKPFDPVELRARVRNLLRERSFERQKQVKELDGERARISRDMHDDIGARLTEIGFMTELMKRDVTDPEKVLPQAQKISETVRDVVSAISEIIWATNPAHDRLDDLLAYIRQYASKYLEQAGMRYRFDFPENFPPLRFEAEERRNVYLVVKEALHNVVKHSHAHEVVILASVAGGGLEIWVVDDGCGFATVSSPSSFGNGLRNMQKRLNEVGGSLRIDSAPGSGTRLKLSMPAKG